MRLICQYSGVEFSATHFGGMRYNSIHPIFEVPVGMLLKRIPDFFKPETTRAERRLHFLALLNSSGLIEWRSIAAPEDKTILNNFQQLADVMKWLDIYQYDHRLSKRI